MHPAVRVTGAEAKSAIARVLDLHTACDCKACLDAARRACAGCTEFAPCPTVLAIRDTPAIPKGL